MQSFRLARNVKIQYLRAIAATFVLVFHASGHYGSGNWLSIIDGRFGVYGVSIFFAISGWLMAELVRANDPWTFLSHRVLRIYPTYFLTVFLMLGLGRLTGVGIGLRPLSMLLLPDDSASFSLGIEWTLVFEVTYYVLLFLISLAGLIRYLDVIAVIWLAAICAALAFDLSWGDALFYPLHMILLSPANAAFAGGLLLPSLIRRGFLPPASALLLLPAMGLYGLFDLGIDRIISSIGAVALVGWAVQRPSKAPKSSVGRALAALGDWSYALYLSHPQVIVIVTALLAGLQLGAPIMWTVVVLAALAFSVPLGILDVRLYRLLRGAANRASAPVRRWGSGLFAAGYVGLAVAISIAAILVQVSVARLGPQAFAGPETAQSRIEATGLSIGSGFVGAFESIEKLPGGETVLRGWAVDREHPSRAFTFRAYCEGHYARSPISPRKSRPDLAQALGDPGLAKRRIGFALVLASPRACAPGSDVFVAAFSRTGRAAVVPGVVKMPAPSP